LEEAEQASRAFDAGGGTVSADREREVERLHAKIGELIVERDFLARVRRETGEE